MRALRESQFVSRNTFKLILFIVILLFLVLVVFFAISLFSKTPSTQTPTIGYPPPIPGG
jgi:flagellar basal body-associated protein FliL